MRSFELPSVFLAIAVFEAFKSTFSLGIFLSRKSEAMIFSIV
jgi:hypothetical protein